MNLDPSHNAKTNIIVNKNTINEITSSFKQLKRASTGNKSVPIAKNYKEAMKLLTK